jgi:acetylornithine deacetylase/succinyl-diaminopimelate desuccinylase-like protein
MTRTETLPSAPGPFGPFAPSGFPAQNRVNSREGSTAAIPYGVQIFRKDGELRPHGNDERMSLDNLRSGTYLLCKIVVEVAKP